MLYFLDGNKYNSINITTKAASIIKSFNSPAISINGVTKRRVKLSDPLYDTASVIVSVRAITIDTKNPIFDARNIKLDDTRNIKLPI